MVVNRSPFARKAAAFIALALMSVPQITSAHGVADPRLKVSVSSTEVRIETTLPASDLPNFPTGEDGGFSSEALSAEYARLADWIDRQLRVETGTEVSITFSDLVAVRSHHAEDPLTHVRVLRRYGYESAESITIRTCLSTDDQPVLLQQTGSVSDWTSVIVEAGC